MDKTPLTGRPGFLAESIRFRQSRLLKWRLGIHQVFDHLPLALFRCQILGERRYKAEPVLPVAKFLIGPVIFEPEPGPSRCRFYLALI